MSEKTKIGLAGIVILAICILSICLSVRSVIQLFV